MAAYVASIPTSSRLSLRSISPRRPISRSSINIRSSSHSCDGVKASTPVLLEPINKEKVNLSGYDEIGIGSPPEAICGLPELKTLAESSEFSPPLTEGKLGQETIRPEEDHINLAPQDSVPKPAGEESHPSSFKESSPRSCVRGTRPKTPSSIHKRKSSPKSFVRGTRPKAPSSRHKRSQRRISRDSKRMVDDETLKNDQEASFASCGFSKQVRDLSDVRRWCVIHLLVLLAGVRTRVIFLDVIAAVRACCLIHLLVLLASVRTCVIHLIVIAGVRTCCVIHLLVLLRLVFVASVPMCAIHLLVLLAGF